MGREEEDKIGAGFKPGPGPGGRGMPYPTVTRDTGRVRVNVGEILDQIGSQTGSITKIEILTPEGTFIIWQNGAAVSPAPTIAVGALWELHISFTATSSVGNYAVFATIVNTNQNMPSAYQRLSVGNRYEASGTINSRLDRNMANMPATDVSLRIKLWITDYYTVDPPPDSGATAW